MKKAALVLLSRLLSFCASSGNWSNEVHGLGHAPQPSRDKGLEHGCRRVLGFTRVIVSTSNMVSTQRIAIYPVLHARSRLLSKKVLNS